MQSLSISPAFPSPNATPNPSENVYTPAPIIPNMIIEEGRPQTISDMQGSTRNNESDDIQKEFRNALNGKTKKKTVVKRRPEKKCPPMPDMSLYIRKDQIPCWGCNLN
jgi:hypothetical protein